MRMSEMFPSNYLKKEDFPSPRVLTISSVSTADIKSDHGTEKKTIVYYQSVEKPMVLNRGNAEVIAENYGGDSDMWIGKPVEVYHDPGVMFGGKRVGGIRIRMPRVEHATAWDMQRCVDECAKAGIGKDEMIAALKAKGNAGFNAARDTPTVQQLIALKLGHSQIPINPPPDSDIPWMIGFVTAGLTAGLAASQLLI